MSVIGKQVDTLYNTVSDKANSVVQTGFPTINVARSNTGSYTEIRANSNNDTLYVRGGNGVIITTNTNTKTLTFSTTSDLRVSQNSVFLSTNNWTTQTSANDTSTWAGVAWSPELGLFASVTSITGANGFRAMTSPDGFTWTIRATPSDIIYRRIIWAPELGLFVAVASSGSLNRIMTSPDGIIWTARTTLDNQFFDATWSKELGLLVAVSTVGTSGNNHIATSPDGIAWTNRTSPANNEWLGVTWSPELRLFAAVSRTTEVAGSMVMTSPDGTNWTLRTSPTNNTWNKVAWSPKLGLFAAVSANGSTDRVMTSPDGSSWTTRTTSASLITYTDIIWVPQYEAFVAVGNNLTSETDRVMISFDGITWTNRHDLSTGRWQQVTWSSELGLLVASGVANRRIMTSQKMGLWKNIDTRMTHAQVTTQLSIGF